MGVVNASVTFVSSSVNDVGNTVVVGHTTSVTFSQHFNRMA